MKNAITSSPTNCVTKPPHFTITSVAVLAVVAGWSVPFTGGLSLTGLLSQSAPALPTAASAPWLVLVGLGGLLAHFCMTKALSLAPAAVVMPVDFARLPIIALVGMAFYAEPLDWRVLLGAAIIFGANYLNIRTETRAAAARSATRPWDRVTSWSASWIIWRIG